MLPVPPIVRSATSEDATHQRSSAPIVQACGSTDDAPPFQALLDAALVRAVNARPLSPAPTLTALSGDLLAQWQASQPQRSDPHQVLLALDAARAYATRPSRP